MTARLTFDVLTNCDRDSARRRTVCVSVSAYVAVAPALSTIHRPQHIPQYFGCSSCVPELLLLFPVSAHDKQHSLMARCVQSPAAAVLTFLKQVNLQSHSLSTGSAQKSKPNCRLHLTYRHTVRARIRVCRLYFSAG